MASFRLWLIVPMLVWGMPRAIAGG